MQQSTVNQTKPNVQRKNVCPVCWGNLEEKIKRDEDGRYLALVCSGCQYAQSLAGEAK